MTKDSIKEDPMRVGPIDRDACVFGKGMGLRFHSKHLRLSV